MKEIEKFIESLTGEQKEQLKAILGVEEKPQSKVWKPKEGEKFYYIDFEGDIVCDDWYDASCVHKWLYESGNCFRTKEEAEFYKEKLLVTAELQRFADEHNEEIDWDDVSPKHCLHYDYVDKRVLIDCSYFIKNSNIIFTNENIVKQAIETIGEERIKKYYLGVME